MNTAVPVFNIPVCPLPDLQNTEDTRGVPLYRVGITEALFPIRVKRKPVGEIEDYDEVSAATKLFVGLPKEYKGVNMSRFYECLVEFAHHPISLNSMPDLLILLQERLKSQDAYARFEFDYYIDKSAPVSGKTAPMAYRCAFTGIKRNGHTDFILEVNVTAASVCPCSREMSLLENLDGSAIEILSYAHPKHDDNPEHGNMKFISTKVGMGAHNQRSQIRVQVIATEGGFIWIEDLVTLIDAQASAPTYPILKRPDEKFVTEQGYNNSKFSEDIARDVHLALQNDPKVKGFAVKIENEESIHPYNCTSYTKSDNWEYSV